MFDYSTDRAFGNLSSIPLVLIMTMDMYMRNNLTKSKNPIMADVEKWGVCAAEFQSFNLAQYFDAYLLNT